MRRTEHKSARPTSSVIPAARFFATLDSARSTTPSIPNMGKISTFTGVILPRQIGFCVKSLATHLSTNDIPLSNVFYRDTSYDATMIQFDTPATLEELKAVITTWHEDQRTLTTLLNSLDQLGFKDHPPSTFAINSLQQHQAFVIEQVRILHAGLAPESAEFDAAYSELCQHFFGPQETQDYNASMAEFLGEQRIKRKRDDEPEVLLPADEVEVPSAASDGTAEPAAKKAKLAEADEPKQDGEVETAESIEKKAQLTMCDAPNSDDELESVKTYIPHPCSTGSLMAERPLS